MNVKISHVLAREVLDSRGFPTVECELWYQAEENGHHVSVASAIVPSGASTGDGEALELRDGDKKRFHGKGVLKAIENIRDRIAPALVGREYSRQALFDDTLLGLDGTPNKNVLGANAILPISMAFARAVASVQKKRLYESLADVVGSPGTTLPVPLMNILNGGKHADNGLALQEFMIVPAGFSHFSDALRAGSEVFHCLKKILQAKGVSTGVGDEGGFAPIFSDDSPHEQALESILQAITDAGYKPGREIFLALDSAASEFVDRQGDGAAEATYRFEGRKLSSSELIELYCKWCKVYPIISIEDGLSEHDWEGWAKLTRELGNQCQLVGDDLFVTNGAYLKRGVSLHVANAILIKLNQIGTVTETLETMNAAREANYSSIVSHRSGESEDTFIADLAVATDCGQIKTGSVSRTDRIAKYNELLRIEQRLGAQARFAGIHAILKQ